MTITVRDIVTNPHLKSVVIAGVQGLDRQITWAHSCDLKDPSRWLTKDVLILTNGLTIPKKEKEQITYLLGIIQTGASGLAVSKGLYAPELSKGLVEVANENLFPVLLTDYEVPWIALSRTVAVANSIEEHNKITQTLRLYDIVRKSIYDITPEDMIDRICKIIQCEIYVMDTRTNKSIFKKGDQLVAKHFKLISESNLASVNYNKEEGGFVILLPIPTTRPLSMLAVSNTMDSPDDLLLKHVATIVGLVIERDATL
ncbi:PucR family transcriptional regulator ligand-binding domain-containing protein [Virgibacillus sp. C22-A2]|uniref:PucR family transcriptional regulator ligand-binding domain-containing protein n=1 Tax=Virgibacillus tibetensis TaxID=3042313 RepID=A0ABU6KMU1_9BACI|nr:PucR family transcriptional regulator ligand-binding domain-containing protein [Virgibacillus sp. C22-A2]